MPNKSVLRRFWSKVDKRGPVHPVLRTRCWLWTGCHNRQGYGQFWMEFCTYLAHRVSWFLVHNRWPKPQALHHCDHPSYVRPDHLFEGGDADNSADRVRKQRSAKGELHGRAKLTEQIVGKIRSTYAAGGTSQATLAQRHGVVQQHISRILHKKRWL